MEKINRSYLRKIRYAIQWSIFLLILYSGYKFYLFTEAIENGFIPDFKRPPSVEGFMPIGALMALKLWITTGIFDPIHPAALIIFIAALTLALLLRKSFCGWVCPVGTLSEIVWKTGRRIFGKNPIIIKYLDYPLRSIKYILLLFFFYVIVIKMSPPEIQAFLNTPYWMVADIKLLKFFTEMSTTTAAVLLLLLGLSLIYKNFWCRYLCPYGGLLGLMGLMSPARIKRYWDRCINCGLCAKNCPSLLPVDKKDSIKSAECTGCLTCVSYCPARDALDVVLVQRRLKPYVFIATVVIFFFGIIIVAKGLGLWHSSVSMENLIQFLPFLHNLEHP